MTAAVKCPREDMAPRLSNVTRCHCNTCDDLEVTIAITVVTVSSRTPIPAARVFSMEPNRDLTLLGISNNFGTFRYRFLVGVGSMVLQVQAMGYISQTLPAETLLPSSPLVVREVVLMPGMDMEVGLGGAPLVVRLGTMLSVSAPARSFRTVEGDVYEDVIRFIGNVVTVSNDADRDTIPQVPFVFTDPETQEERYFGMVVGWTLMFVGRSGEPLSNREGMLISVSILPSDEGSLDLLTFDSFLGVWNKTSEMRPAEPLRKKRQNINPVIFEGQSKKTRVVGIWGPHGIGDPPGIWGSTGIWGPLDGDPLEYGNPMGLGIPWNTGGPLLGIW